MVAKFTKASLLNIYHACLKFGKCWVCSDGQMYQTENDCDRHIRFRRDQEREVLRCCCTAEDMPRTVEELEKRFYSQSIKNGISEKPKPPVISLEEAKRRFDAMQQNAIVEETQDPGEASAPTGKKARVTKKVQEQDK